MLYGTLKKNHPLNINNLHTAWRINNAILLQDVNKAVKKHHPKNTQEVSFFIFSSFVYNWSSITHAVTLSFFVTLVFIKCSKIYYISPEVRWAWQVTVFISVQIKVTWSKCKFTRYSYLWRKGDTTGHMQWGKNTFSKKLQLFATVDFLTPISDIQP